MKVARAPSIPCRDQSYGYEEGPSGEMVMQRPPSTGYTGRGRDTAGPGSYVPVDTLSRKTRNAPDFSRSSGRKDPIGSRKNLPGPGDYNPSKDLRQNLSTKLRPHAAFVSSSSRSSFMNSHQAKIPGPGSYSYTSSIRREFVPKAFQNFGSNQPRDLPLKNQVPGPGSYELKPTLNIKEPQIIDGQPVTTDYRPFNSSSSRFPRQNLSTANLVGPGSYTDGLMNASKPRSSSVGRYGVFGSTSSRFRDKPDDKPGPGQYDPPAKINPLKNRIAEHSSAFASTAPRGVSERQRERIQELPGPGQYSTPGFLEQKVERIPRPHVPFGTTQPRDQRVSGEGPGPGSYDLGRSPTKPGSLAQGFGCMSPRFRDKVSEGLGPGVYEVTKPLDRKSFNVTYDV